MEIPTTFVYGSKTSLKIHQNSLLCLRLNLWCFRSIVGRFRAIPASFSVLSLLLLVRWNLQTNLCNIHDMQQRLSLTLHYICTGWPHVRESGKFCLWNPESEKILLMNFEILGFGIRNTAQGIRNPTDFLESRNHVLLMNTVIWNPESTAWNPESKTVSDSLTWGKYWS